VSAYNSAKTYEPRSKLFHENPGFFNSKTQFKMNSKVVVTANEKGEVVIPTENPSIGYSRVSQTVRTVDENGWLRPEKRSALVKGPIGELRAMGLYAGSELSGNIVVRESLTPFNKKDPKKDLKRAGDGGPICTFQGMPVYRTCIWDPTGTKQDEFVSHDNVDEIRNFIKALEEKESKTPVDKV
jgi:hypothetical protein